MFADPAIRRLADEMRRVGRLLGARGILVADDGNLSVRCPDGSILITARGVRKDRLRRRDLVRIDARGEGIDGEALPSTELGLHLEVYARRPDVGAIVHAHPPCATGFAIARVRLSQDCLAEAALALGPVPVVPFSAPGTEEVAEAVRPFLAGHQALLLAHHGAVVFGADLESACRRMERLELVARAVVAAGLIGEPRCLSREQLEELNLKLERDYSI